MIFMILLMYLWAKNFRAYNHWCLHWIADEQYSSLIIYQFRCWRYNKVGVGDLLWLWRHFYRALARGSCIRLLTRGCTGSTFLKSPTSVLCNVVFDIHRWTRQSLLQRTALPDCQTLNLVGVWHSLLSVRRNTDCSVPSKWCTERYEWTREKIL